MKKLIKIMILLVCPFIGFSQTTTNKTKIDSVSFKAKVNLKTATKDGIYLNGYVVKIPYKELKKIDGKTIVVKGVLTIRKGLKNTPKLYDKNGNEIIRQGRDKDVMHIKKPKYRVIKE